MMDLIDRQAAIDVMQLAIEDDWEYDYAIDRLNEIPPAQPELIEESAYIRGFKQGRTQGMIDSHCMGVSSGTVGRGKQ